MSSSRDNAPIYSDRVTHQENQATVLVFDLVRQVDALALSEAAVSLGQHRGEVRSFRAVLDVDFPGTMGEVASAPDEPTCQAIMFQYLSIFQKDVG